MASPLWLLLPLWNVYIGLYPSALFTGKVAMPKQLQDVWHNPVN